nr:family 78 glycoside hydrolase catalytic domain [Bacteroidales bacterium]
MKNYSLFYLIIILLASCSAKEKNKVVDPFLNAQWIAYEQLADSLKIIPAVPGEGNHLGNRGLKRSTIPLFRKEFKASTDIKHASISICGLGHYELYINGAKIGNRFLAPGWSLYQKRTLFNTYDITENINKGDNVVGVIVGNGFYNINRERYRKFVVAYGYPRLIFNLRLEMQDGSVKNVVSDSHCKVSPSAITFSSIYGGESYDARLEQENWNNLDFDDTQWQHPVILNDTIGELVLEEDYPLKIMQTFKPQEVFTSKTGRVIFDFGQNASGIISLKVKGNRGAQITIRPDELINEEGNITQQSGGGPYSFSYTLKGQGTEVWQPRFTYYGFRYADVEIIEPENAVQKTEIIKLKMLHTRNSSPTVGTFECSDTLFNQIYKLINWGIKSNMASVTTDCPHREKLGWLEQTYLIGPSMHYNFDISALYNKIVNDMIDSQLDNGLVPNIAPEYVPFGDGFRDSPEWGSASVIIPWQLYKWYNNFEVLKRAYPMMTRYMAYLHSKSDKNILYHGLGDWYDLGPKHPGVAQLTPKAVTATSIYYYDLIILAK